MKKVYGYKENDILSLAEELKNRKNQTLTEIFSDFAKKSGKARGTVRNMYYALAKLGAEDAEFRNKYLDGKIPQVSKIVVFGKDEEKELIKKVLIGKSEGRSVRSVIMELAEGDGKKALRYQNKFRGAVKNKPREVEKIAAELNLILNDAPSQLKEPSDYVGEVQLRRLKSEINSLVAKIAAKEKRENSYLKDKLALLEAENIRLKNALYGGGERNSAIRYLRRNRAANAAERSR